MILSDKPSADEITACLRMAEGLKFGVAVQAFPTLRQFYAGMALQGILGKLDKTVIRAEVCRDCFYWADAMLSHEAAEKEGT